VKSLNVPSILITSSGGLLATQADTPTLKFVKEIPYDWLFPHCKAVVHHGGSGTTHTALRYGCASMIIPHIIDQFFWNRLIARRGIGPLGPSVSRLQQATFTQLLEGLLNQAAYRQAARAIAKQMQGEDAETNFLRVVSSPRTKEDDGKLK
jgi:sterol 3beta-glucosyltransferase